MKNSPFTFFRKHQRVGMVILTVTAMFAFVFLDQTFRGVGATHASTVAVKIKGGNLTHEQLGNLISQRVAANRFIQAAAEAVMEDNPKDQEAQTIARAMFQQQFGQDFPGQPESETNVMWSHIMRLEAKRMGMAVTDNTVESYISRLLRRMVTADRYQEILKKIRLSEKHLYDVFREEILSKMAATALFPRVTQTPEQYWEFYKRLKVQQNLEVAALPVKEFAKSIPDPSDSKLETLFNEYKTRYPGDAPDYWKPGFRQPTKVRVQYLTTSDLAIEKRVEEGKDPYTKPITDKDIVEYYEKNKDRLYTELDLDLPKDGAEKKEDSPIDPSIAPEKSSKSDPATPATDKPTTDKPAGDKPAADKPKAPAPEEKPAEKPADPAAEKPAGDKPAEPKTEKPAEKPAAPAETKPEAKPEEKPAEKPAESAEKKPCGEDPVVGEKPAAEKTEESKPAEAKAADAKPEETKPTAEKPTTEKPAAEPKPDPNAKPAKNEEPKATTPEATETKPSTDARTDAKADGKTDGKPADTKPVKPPKYKPLTDDLKTEIREGLVDARVLESMKKLGEEAKTLLEEDQLKYAYGPSVAGMTVFVDFNENGKYDEGEPSVESEKKLDQTDISKLPPELVEGLNAQVFDMTKAEMTRIGKKLGLEYAETDLISLRDLEDKENLALRSLSKVVDINDNPFQPNDAGKIRQELFGTESRFHVKVGKDDETRLYVYWKVEHIKEHIAKFTDKGIKEEVLAAWKLLEAYPEAKKRAEELVEKAKGKKDLRDAFKGEKVSGDEQSLDLDVHETGDFTWMSTGVPSPQMMQASQVKLSHVEWTDDKIDDDFMRVACEDLAVGDVGYAPNRDHTVIFVIRVVNRGAKTGDDMAKLRETFMKEQLFDSFPAGLDPSLRQYFPPPAYSQMAFQENSRVYFEWLESLKKKYQVTWTDELRNY